MLTVSKKLSNVLNTDSKITPFIKNFYKHKDVKIYVLIEGL